jgi:similar to tr
MGALIAFEVCRCLRISGAEMPDRLLVSGFRAPQLPNPNLRIHHLPDEVLRTVMIKDGMPPALLQEPDFMAALLPILRADLEMCDEYEYQDLEPLSIPVTAFGGTEDRRVDEQSLQAWETQTTAEFHKFLLPGPHLFVNDPDSGLLAHIREQLDLMVKEENNE